MIDIQKFMERQLKREYVHRKLTNIGPSTFEEWLEEEELLVKKDNEEDYDGMRMDLMNEDGE